MGTGTRDVEDAQMPIVPDAALLCAIKLTENRDRSLCTIETINDETIAWDGVTRHETVIRVMRHETGLSLAVAKKLFS
jgi:hypothetical protein